LLASVGLISAIVKFLENRNVYKTGEFSPDKMRIPGGPVSNKFMSAKKFKKLIILMKMKFSSSKNMNSCEKKISGIFFLTKRGDFLPLKPEFPAALFYGVTFCKTINILLICKAKSKQ